ncbi:MAG TPA: geranylgeranyl reductase family protein [Vicinamibacterales bacterium]|nr:geranylgeranyl reductase family protein [Vicinamibacterales bacterium]
MIAISSPPDSVIVLGAGPAGATAARALALRGIAVRLLDRAAFPRNKPCGGGISVRVLTRFPYLERELARIATHAVSRLYLEGPDGDATVVESDGPAALMIRRVEFDALLVSLAQQAGAALVTGADIVQAHQDNDAVTLVARDGRRFRAPIVIAADGVYSVVARRLGINPGWSASAVALDMMEETPRSALRDVDPSTLWVSYGFNPSGGRSVKGRSAAEGYAYIFPKRDHVNIGIGYVLSHYRAAVGHAPYDLQRGFVAALRERGIVVGDSVRSNFTPFLIPVGGPLRHPARGRVLLAGDAGGFVNGFTAEGIYYAMVTGDLAGRAVAAGGDIRSLAARYRRACDYEIGAELRDSVLIQRYLFADRRRIAGVIQGTRRETATTRAVLEFAVGRRSYRSLRRRLLARSPVLAGRLVWEKLRTNFVVPRSQHS